MKARAARAAHLNMFGWRSPGVHPETPEEKEYAARAAQLFELEGAYFREHTTKPQTLSYAMMDSPVGACAWIVEKFHGWSDTRKASSSVYSMDQLLTNVMIYLVTRTFNTATWLYRGLAEDPERTARSGRRPDRKAGRRSPPFRSISSRFRRAPWWSAT